MRSRRRAPNCSLLRPERLRRRKDTLRARVCGCAVRDLDQVLPAEFSDRIATNDEPLLPLAALHPATIPARRTIDRYLLETCQRERSPAAPRVITSSPSKWIPTTAPLC